MASAFVPLLRLLRDAETGTRVAEARPVARCIVLFLAERGGASDLSEVELAQALGRAPSAIAANLAWLEAEGALLVTRRRSGGLRLASMRSVDVKGALALFKRVLGRVAASVAGVVRRVRALRITRAFRPRPADRVHTPVTPAVNNKIGSFLSSGPSPDASQLLARHGRGEICLEPATLRDLIAQVAGEMGMSSDDVCACFRVTR